jgi:DNA-binding CsgD family transcriptional regulator
MHPVPKPDQRSMNAAVGSPELTPRETEVLFWISEGKSNRDISIILGAKTRTICKHVEHIFSKLNVEIGRRPHYWHSKSSALSRRNLETGLVNLAPQLLA